MTIQTIPRRLPEVGRLRLGQKINGTRPAALAAWRLTSKSRFRLDAAAQVYGGTVNEWKDAPGEDPQWELFTEAKALRVAVVPAFNPDGTLRSPVSQFYEHWSAGGCQRRCDGVTELLSGDPCLCRMEADDPTDYKCRPTTRLSVLLPDLPGLGVWRVETHGYYGASELAASAELLASFGRPMPVALIIDQRSEKRPGQARRDYVVPMLDSRQSFLDLQALAAADPVTGEMAPAQRPAIDQSSGVGGDTPAAQAGSEQPTPDPTSGEVGEREAPELQVQGLDRHDPTAPDPTSGVDGPPTGTPEAKAQPGRLRPGAGSRTTPDPTSGAGSSKAATAGESAGDSPAPDPTSPPSASSPAGGGGHQSPPARSDLGRETHAGGGPKRPPTPVEKAQATEAVPAGVEGAQPDGTEPDVGSPHSPDVTAPPEPAAEAPPRQPSGGTKASRSAGPGKPKADRDDPEAADQAKFEAMQASDDHGKWTR